MNVLDNIKKQSFSIPPVITYISSWFTYGQNHEIPFREDFSQCNPTGFYSITKRCAEQLLICWCQTFGFKYRIFRLANVLGEGDKKISKKKNALQYLIKEIVNDRDVELYYGGDVLRDYIYVDDVCEAMKLCMDKAPVNQIYNIGSGVPSRFLDIINEAIEVAQSKSKIIHIQPSQFHNIVQVRHSYLDTTKITNLGFQIKHPIQDVVKKLVKFYQNEI
jgi:nucleoside-diphosphate-sugar epimerase